MKEQKKEEEEKRKREFSVGFSVNKELLLFPRSYQKLTCGYDLYLGKIMNNNCEGDYNIGYIPPIYIPPPGKPVVEDKRLDIKSNINKEIARQNARYAYIKFIRIFAAEVDNFVDYLSKKDKEELGKLLDEVRESI